MRRSMTGVLATTGPGAVLHSCSAGTAAAVATLFMFGSVVSTYQAPVKRSGEE